MRIGQVAHASIGGSARVGLELAGTLADRGHPVHFFAGRPVAGASGRGFVPHWLTARDGAVSAHLDKDWPERRVDAFAEMVAAGSLAAGLDVVHFHYALPFAQVAVRLRGLLGSRCPALVMTLHGTDVSELEGVATRELCQALAAVDVLTTVSASHAALVTETLHVDAPTVIPNFVDLGRFRPRTWPARARRPRIAHVSNFRPVKNPAAAARVFSRVALALDAELWLIGDGELLPSVREILAADGLLGRVRFCGLRLDVHRLLRRADVLLVTSRTESFALAALEAMACGAPVVAPRVGGLPEVVVDGSTGTLFEPGDEEAAAGAVERILSDRRLLGSMRRAARRRACAFASDAVVARYEALYRAALGERAAPADDVAPAFAGVPAAASAR